MFDFPECDCFKDHRRDICRNEQRNRELNGPNSVNAFRKLWGMQEIAGPNRPPQNIVPHKVTVYRSDTRVKQIAREKSQQTAFACINRGQKMRDDTSNLCGSRGEQVAVFECSVHGECSLSRYCQHQRVQACNRCGDREEFRRHLIGHIYPRRGNWRWNVEELKKRLSIFNGTRSIGIVTDDTTDSASEVRAAFDGERIDRWIELPNNPKQREGVTFFPLMDELPRGHEDLTWYWHGKSAQYGNGITRHWADAQNRIMLDGWRDVQNSLREFAITGAFKRRTGWQLPRASKWHYTGTAFAFRNADVFSRNWRRLTRHFFCVEFWPPMLFSDDEAGCVFGDGADDLYKMENWTEWNQQLAEKFGLNSAAELATAATAG